MELDLGPAEQLPTDTCIATPDGRAVVVRVDGQVLAFASRCLHKDASLAGGRIVDGKLQCPLHFWRYALPDGQHVGGRGALPRYPVRIREGHALVSVPDPVPAGSIRDLLLAHARTWDRGEQ
jgi:nitrite reductase/ring-hydroxylating ferredoxin subunit